MILSVGGRERKFEAEATIVRAKAGNLGKVST